MIVSKSFCAAPWLRLYPKSPPIPSFTIPYTSPLKEFTWRSEWKRMSEFTHWVHRKDCHFCIVCLLFNNHLKQASPAVRLKDLYWTICALSEGIGNDFGYSLCLLCFRLLSARCLIGYCLVSCDNLQIKRAFVLSVSPPTQQDFRCNLNMLNVYDSPSGRLWRSSEQIQSLLTHLTPQTNLIK